MGLFKSQISGLTIGEEIYEYGVIFKADAHDVKASIDAGHAVKVESVKVDHKKVDVAPVDDVEGV